MNIALFALTAGAFGIGVTEFVIMGLLLEISKDMAVSISMLALAMTLGLMSVGMHNKILAILLVGLLGAAAFATVAPLQMWVLNKAIGAGQSLASSLNIAAFNLGNALGAWLGGVVIDHGPGLNSIFWIAALLPLIAIGITLLGAINKSRSSGTHAQEYRS